jgi:hypothetical protein
VFLLDTIERSPRCLLEVIYNCHPSKDSEANSWGYRCFDEEGDGFVEVGFGPDGSELDQVVFTWDIQSGEYRVRGDVVNPHLRIIGDGKGAAEFAREFRYPLLREESERMSKSGTYRFVSLKGLEHESYREFFNGRRLFPITTFGITESRNHGITESRNHGMAGWRDGGMAEEWLRSLK